MPLSDWSADDELTSARLNEMVAAFNSVEAVAGGTFTDGLVVTKASASVYALSVQNTNSANLIQKWVNHSGGNVFIMTNTGLFNADGSAGLAIGTGLSNNLIAVSKTYAGASSTSYIAVDIGLNVENASGDHGGFRSVVRQLTAGGGDSGARAGEFHAVCQRTNGTVGNDWAALEVGVHSMTPSGSDTEMRNYGIFVYADTATWAGNVGAAVPQDVAYLAMHGYDGFKDFFRAVGAAPGFTEHFRVSGGIRSGDVVGDVVSAGRFRASNGTASLPSLTFDGDLNTGMFRAASDNIGLAVGGSEVIRVTNLGLLDFRSTGSQTVALGGGAAPTLGTIGGSGPATAGQAAWLKISLNGTAAYVPYWQ